MYNLNPAIVIEPRQNLLHAGRDYVVLGSEWTDENHWATVN